MGLGDRGKAQVKLAAPKGLFAKTEPEAPAEIHDSVNTEIQFPENTEICKSISEKNDQRKMYNISLSLAERLRRYTYENRRKEAEIVREALDSWLKKEGY